MSLKKFIKETKTTDPLDSQFMTDPEAIRSALVEVARIDKKADLIDLCDDYRIGGSSGKTLDQLREVLYTGIRAGNRKMKRKWEAKCTCNKASPYRRLVTASNQPDPDRCDRCSEVIIFKRYRAR